jgi:HEAT repeat protein
MSCRKYLVQTVFYPTLLVVLLFFPNPGLPLQSGNIKSTELNNKRIETLIRALVEGDVETRGKAAETLGKLRDKRAVQPLIKALGDSNLGVRKNAALALGKIGDARAIKSLIEALNDLAFHVREAAAKALGKLGDSRAVAPLFIALGDSETVVRAAAGNSLKKLGETGGYLLYKAIYTSKDEAVEKLKNESPSRLFDNVLKAFDQWDPKTRERVVWVLGSLQNEHVIDFLIICLSDTFSGVRTAAVWSLGKIGGKRTVGPLLNALDDSSGFVREAAALNLGETHDSSVVEPLIKILDDKKPKVREAALWSLMKIGDIRAFKPAIDALDAPEEKIRIAAAWTLGALGDAAAVSPLIRALNDYDEYVREAAIWSLIKISGQSAANFAIKALEDRSPVVRSAAAYALGYIGGDHVIMPLINAIADKHAEVREAAVSSLIKLNKPLGSAISEILGGNLKALKELEIKKDHRFSAILVEALNSNIPEIRYAAAWYLGEVKEPRAIDNLVKMAKSWNLQDRFYGMVGLSKLKIDGLDNNFSLTLKIFVSISSLIYYLLTMLIFAGIISMIPVGRRKLHFLTRVAIACLVAGVLVYLPAVSLTSTYFAFLATGTLILPFISLLIMVPIFMCLIKLKSFRPSGVE